MKSIGVVLAFCLLEGCGTYHTLEELEQEAMLTGDWSQVERRERKIAERAIKKRHSCPGGRARLCQSSGAIHRCGCVSTDDLRLMLTR